MVMEFSVKPWYQIRPNVAMIDVGMAIAAMMRRAPVPEEHEHHQRREDRADDEVLLDAVDRRPDELRLVADDADLVAGRGERRDFGQPLPDGVDDLDGVRARLPADRQQDAGLAVQAGRRVRLGHAVFDRRDVAQEHRMAFALMDDDVAEVRRPTATRPRVRSVMAVRALLDAAAGNLGVLRLERARDVGDGEVVGAQPVGIEQDVDLPGAAADDDDLADAADAFELPAEHLVGVLGDVADRLVGRDRERQDRRRIGIELLDRRLLDGPRQAAAARG